MRTQYFWANPRFQILQLRNLDLGLFMFFIRSLIFLLSLFSFSFLVHAENLVEGIVAVIHIKNREPIREVIFYSDLERYRLFFAPLKEKTDPIHLVNQVIHQRLFRHEARRFVLKKPSRKTIKERFRLIRRRFQNETAFQEALLETGLNLDEFKEEILEHLWVEDLLNERIKEFIFISPKKVEAYFKDHPDLFAGRRLEEVEKRIEAFLTMEKASQKKEKYIQRLKSKAEIKILLGSKTNE